jgi:hypothetical protein
MYRDRRRLLQYRQWQDPKGRWLLKSPQHLFDLPGLMEIYPDARIVWTHRDPVSALSRDAERLERTQGESRDRGRDDRRRA